MAGDAIGIYGEGLGLPVKETSYFTSLTLASMLVGYVVGLITIPRYLSQERYLAYSAILGIILVAGASLTQGSVSVACVALLGFENAMLWPAHFPPAFREIVRPPATGAAMLLLAIRSDEGRGGTRRFCQWSTW